MSGVEPESQPNAEQAIKTSQLGKYVLVGRVGKGGMGTVYRAEDAQLGRTVALKVLLPRLAKNKKFTDRFVREARAAAALNHPGIVKALDVGQVDGTYYFVMEFVDGVTIRKRLSQEKQFAEKEAVEIIVKVAQAIQHASRKRIIHRDIKPENVMMTADGQVKLMDFGLARATDASDTTIKVPGFFGTPQYASPEQIRGEEGIDGRTDIYSLGLTFYHMVTGVPAFDGPTPDAVLAKQLNDPLPDPKAARADLSNGLCRIIQKMCEKEPDDRYQDAEELVEDLRLLQDGKPLRFALPTLPTTAQRRSAARGRGRRRSRGWGAWVAAAAGIAVIAGAAAVFFLRPGILKTQPDTPVVESPKSVPPKATPPPTEAPHIEDGPRQDAKTASAIARKFLRENPDELGTIVNLFSEVLKFPGTPEAQAAQLTLDQIHDSVRRAFEPIESTAKRHLAAGEYLKAMAAIETFPERCQFGTWDERYQALKEDCRSRTETASQKLEAQGVKAIEDGRLADMEKILETLQKNFPEGHATRARDAFDALKERVDETRRRERVLRIKRYKEFYALHERELKERRYQEFLDAAQKCQGDPDYEVLRAEMKMETEHGRMLLQLLQYVEEGAKKRLNKPFQLLGQSLTLMGVEAGNLVLRMGRDGPQMRVSIARKLKTQDILNLAQGEIAGDPNGKIMTGAFYFAEGDLPKAREQWMASAEEGKDVKLALWTIDVLGRDEREVEAQESISKIQGRFEGCKWDEVVQLIDEARKAHEGTAALNQARADLNRMMAEAKNRSGKTTAAAGPEGDRSRRIPLGRVETSNGLEQYMDWRHLAWPTGSGRGTLGFTGLKGQDDPNRVMQFRFQDVAGKIFLGREAAMDFSARKRLLVQVRNPSRTRIKMSLALCTGPRFEYYESPIECDLPAESARAHRFRLQASDFKCAASGWNWTSRVTDLQDVRRVVFVIHTEKQDGELIFEHIGLVD